MRTFQHISQLRSYLRGVREEGKEVGLVPTMGALHEGHLSLIRRAKGESDLVVVSLFVNPTQFNEREDYANYPRDLNHDSYMAAHEGVDALFMPEPDEIYPAGFQTTVDVPELSATLEGAHRPGHFRGVATIVTKLLNIVQPDRAYFGQKDFQQILVVERLIRDLNLLTSIVRVPTLREPDGLALSSRNVRLTPEQRCAATILYRALSQAETLVAGGETDAARIQQAMESLIASERLAAPEYVALVHPDTLQPATTLRDAVTLAALAVRFGDVRLIDNTLLAPPGVPLNKYRGGKG